MKPYLVLSSLLFVGFGTFGYLLNPFQVSAQGQEEFKIDFPVDLNNTGFLKGPKMPSFRGNKNLDINKFISKERAIGKVPEQAKLAGSALKEWGQFKIDNLKGSTVDDIAPDRMVWEVALQFPKGIELGGDKYYDAVLTKAVDGETGDVIYFKVSTPAEKLVRGKRLEVLQK